MDCNTARFLSEVAGLRGAELQPEETVDLLSHLDACRTCAEREQRLRRNDDRIARAMKVVPVPPLLKAQILDRLASERGAYYRRRIGQILALAASILLVVGLTSNFTTSSRTKFELAEVANWIDHQASKPKESAERWLASEQKLAPHPPVSLPPPISLNYRLLASYGSGEILPGKSAPMLYFVAQGGVWAKVYILDSKDFDFRHIQDSSIGDDSTSRFGEVNIRFFRDTKQGDRIAYLIIYKGDSLAPFLERSTSI